MAAPDLAGLLEALPEGKSMWIEARGRSMWPLLWPGDSLNVLRCSARDLQRGDVSVMRRGDGALISHLCISTAPTVTVNFAGRPDEGLVVLARGLAFRRRRLKVPLVRAPALALRHTYAAAARSPLLGVWRWLSTSPATRTARQTLLGSVEIEELSDLHELALALSRWEYPSQQQLERTRAVAARSRSGNIVGLALTPPERVHVLSRYQGLGLEERLLSRIRSSHQGG